MNVYSPPRDEIGLANSADPSKTDEIRESFHSAIRSKEIIATLLV